jgi:hypothetical protein
LINIVEWEGIMKAIKIHPTGAIENIELVVDDDVRRHQLQNAVDGWTQRISLGGFAMVIDKEPEPLAHPLVNRLAQQILTDYLPSDRHSIHGTVVLLAEDETSDLPLFVAEYLGLFSRHEIPAAA